MTEKDGIGIGIIGLGVIAGQVARVLCDKQTELAGQAGCQIILRKIKVLPEDLGRSLAQEIGIQLFTTEADVFFSEPGMDIVVEAIGGEHPALEYLTRAICSGRHVVTSNKEVIAKHGYDLLDLAYRNGVTIRYEASVGGGIPLISRFRHDLVANRIEGIYAIINGTTNYILTRMAEENAEFSVALAKAQELGYAEANPGNDIEGIDAGYKLAILASLAFHTRIRPEDIYREGISRLCSRDFQYARELGLAIKLLAIAKENKGAVEVRVHPVCISQESLLAKVDGVYNAVLVKGDLVGNVLFFGQGAGPLPTSSAVIADVVSAAQDVRTGVPKSKWNLDEECAIKSISDIETRFYIRLNIADRPGVLAQIAGVLGDRNISISSAIQKLADRDAQTAEIVIITHPAMERSMQSALEDLAHLTDVMEVNNFIRVEALS